MTTATDRAREDMLSEINLKDAYESNLDSLQEQIERLQQEAATVKVECDAARNRAIEIAAINDLDEDLKDELGYYPDELRDIDAFDQGQFRYYVGDEVALKTGDGRTVDAKIVRLTRAFTIVEIDEGGLGPALVRLAVKRSQIVSLRCLGADPSDWSE